MVTFHAAEWCTIRPVEIRIFQASEMNNSLHLLMVYNYTKRIIKDEYVCH